MKLQWYAVMLFFAFIGTGCIPLQMSGQSESFPGKSAYWDGPAQNFTVGQVLNYFRQLRSLSGEATAGEAQRAAKAYADQKRPVDAIQYLLVLAVSGISSENKPTIAAIFADLRENATLMHRDVQELLFLIESFYASNLASQGQDFSADLVSRATEIERADFEKKLKACRQQSQLLADKIQKLKDIERILTDRELKEEQK
jgi:hypothetical protein